MLGAHPIRPPQFGYIPSPRILVPITQSSHNCPGFWPALVMAPRVLYYLLLVALTPLQIPSWECYCTSWVLPGSSLKQVGLNHNDTKGGVMNTPTARRWQCTVGLSSEE